MSFISWLDDKFLTLVWRRVYRKWIKFTVNVNYGKYTKNKTKQNCSFLTPSSTPALSNLPLHFISLLFLKWISKPKRGIRLLPKRKGRSYAVTVQCILNSWNLGPIYTSRQTEIMLTIADVARKDRVYYRLVYVGSEAIGSSCGGSWWAAATWQERAHYCITD